MTDKIPLSYEFYMYPDELELLKKLKEAHKVCAKRDKSIAPHYYDVIFHQTSVATIPEFHCPHCGFKKILANERYDWI